MARSIRHRQGTAAEWSSANPVLAKGEIGYVTDTGEVRIGDGSTAWASLGVFNNAALSANYATGGEVRSKAKADGTDQTATLQGELDALYDAGGGTLVIPASPLGAVPIKVTNLTLKNDGAVPAKMPTIGIRGQGMHWSGRGTAPQGGTIIEFTGTDTYGLLKSNALGALVLEGITFRNTTTTTTTPFIYTTNTTLLVSRCAFYGAKTGAACDQDAIVLGGPNQIEGGSGWTDGFQGYGTVISECFFSGIRRGVVGQAFANAVIVRDNTWWTTCGHPTGAAIEWDGQPTTGTQSTAGCVIAGNLIELPNYKYGIKVARSASFTLDANNFYDPTVTTTATVYLDAETQGCVVREGFTAPGLAPLVDDGANNWFYSSSQGIYSKMPPARFLDVNYPTTIRRLLVDGTGGGFVIQPNAATSDTSIVAQVKRSATEATNPDAPVWSLKQSGEIQFDTTASAGGNWYSAYARMTGGGRTWSSIGNLAGQTNGGAMRIDSGPGGSNVDIRAWKVRLLDQTDVQSGIELQSGTTYKGAIKTGTGATASRPSAASCGQGAQWFDTTLNKPIWSDGTNWRDATGTVV